MTILHDIFLAVKGGAELENVIPSGSDITYWRKRLICYGIITPDGKLATTRNRLSGKVQQEIYSRKSAAQQQADWYNRQAN